MKIKRLFGICAFAGMALGLSFSAHAQNAKVGSVQIENAYTRATVPGQQVAGGFMKIENKGAADQLVSASSPVAGEVQLHEMAMDGNVMKMRQVKDIAVPAGGAVELKPGGLHLMLMGLSKKIVPGTEVDMKLIFSGDFGDEKTQTITLENMLAKTSASGEESYAPKPMTTPAE